MARLKSLCGLAAKNRFPKYGGPPPERVLTPLYNRVQFPKVGSAYAARLLSKSA